MSLVPHPSSAHSLSRFLFLSLSHSISLFLPCFPVPRGRVCLQSLACKYHCLPCGSLIKYACNAMWRFFLSAYCHTAATLISVIGLPASLLSVSPRGQLLSNYFKCQLINCKTFFCESTTNPGNNNNCTQCHQHTHSEAHLRTTSRDNEVAAVDMKRDEHKNPWRGPEPAAGRPCNLIPNPEQTFTNKQR